MRSFFKITLCTIITSLYFFPFEFTFLPGMNTKMALAGIGLFILALNVSKKENSEIDKYFFLSSLFAVGVSAVAFLSTVVNRTTDYTYATYIISMWVWMSGAYTTIHIIKAILGRMSIEVTLDVLLCVCVSQCILALLIDNIPSLSSLVNRYISNVGFVQMDRLEQSSRLYGIGCALDVAGTRFAAVLIITAFITSQRARIGDSLNMPMYIIAFAIITVVGNMISRTTLLGSAIALAIWGYTAFSMRKDSEDKTGSMTVWIIITALAAFVISSYLYRNSPIFKENIRFAFEGFFSLVEKGHWETNSNNILKTMIVWPESLHTWIIGDGYIESPLNDMNYVGEYYKGYYMKTDIGYLRFIFYFGVIGLISFINFFFYFTYALIQKKQSYKWLFILMLILNCIIWMKVATDIFIVFAILYSSIILEDNDVENHNLHNISV